MTWGWAKPPKRWLILMEKQAGQLTERPVLIVAPVTDAQLAKKPKIHPRFIGVVIAWGKSS